MSEFKGTPGPWHVSNEGCMLIRDDAGLSIVAKYVGYTNDEEELANAKLIAAAPELLEALRWALEWIDAVPSDTALPTMPGFDRDEVNNIINKALGEAK